MGNSYSAEPLISILIDQFPLIWRTKQWPKFKSIRGRGEWIHHAVYSCSEYKHCFREDFDPEWLKDTSGLWFNKIFLKWRIFCHKRGTSKLSAVVSFLNRKDKHFHYKSKIHMQLLKFPLCGPVPIHQDFGRTSHFSVLFQTTSRKIS